MSRKAEKEEKLESFEVELISDRLVSGLCKRWAYSSYVCASFNVLFPSLDIPNANIPVRPDAIALISNDRFRSLQVRLNRVRPCASMNFSSIVSQVLLVTFRSSLPFLYYRTLRIEWNGIARMAGGGKGGDISRRILRERPLRGERALP